MEKQIRGGNTPAALTGGMTHPKASTANTSSDPARSVSRSCSWLAWRLPVPSATRCCRRRTPRQRATSSTLTTVVRRPWRRPCPSASVAVEHPALPGDEGAVRAADGAIPDGTTVFDVDFPGVANLDADLLRALRRAATDARDDGVDFVIDSGWRSAAYQAPALSCGDCRGSG